jgi:hypothetical protein
MTLPGFNAETSLYKTSVHYRLMGASVQADGVMPQQFINWGVSCGTCFLDSNGNCVRICGRRLCVTGEPWPCTWIAPCDPSACPPPQVDCDKAQAACKANGGIIFDCHDLVPDGCAACPPCCFRCT